MRKDRYKDAGEFQGHCECPFKKCGSSDAGAYYLHSDGSYSYYCYSCEGTLQDFKLDGLKPVSSSRPRIINWEVELERLEEVRDSLVAIGSKERRIKASDYEFYGVHMELDKDGEQIDKVWYPTFREGQHCGYRCRSRFKETDEAVIKDPSKLGVLKNFRGGIGDTQKGIELFGQWLFPEGGKFIILTCGEEDAIASAVMTKMKSKYNEPWPSVSVPSGEKVAWVQPHIKYLSSFEKIFIVPDPDEAGQKFEAELCRILPVGKVHLVRLPKKFKDPSALRSAGRNSQEDSYYADIYWKALWDAQPYSPVGIKTLDDVWDSYKNLGDEQLIPLPDSFGELQTQTGGLELGGIHGIVASTSVGKTCIVGEILYNARLATNYNIGVCSAEDTVEEYLRTLISLHINKPLKEYSKAERDLEEEFEAKEFLKGETGNRFHLVEHAGTADLDELLEKVEWLITAQDCKLIALDPVTLLVGSESTSLDDFMSDILKLAKRHMVAFLLVFHTRKTGQGQAAASQGAEVTIEDIKSSGSGGQVCSSILLLNRNKEHENKIVKNTTTARWGKFRRKGSVTGLRDYIFYEAATGRLRMGTNPQTILEDLEDSNEKGDWD